MLVRDDRSAADVQVFQGRVDGQHLRSGKLEQMTTGQNRRFEAERIVALEPQTESGPPAAEPVPSRDGERLRITTAMGRGKDSYVQPLVPSKNSSDILLLVKNTSPKAADYNRKAYLAFDLAAINSRQPIDASVTLTFAATGMGLPPGATRHSASMDLSMRRPTHGKKRRFAGCIRRAIAMAALH